jgi:hypothetical protein
MKRIKGNRSAIGLVSFISKCTGWISVKFGVEGVSRNFFSGEFNLDSCQSDISFTLLEAQIEVHHLLLKLRIGKELILNVRYVIKIYKFCLKHFSM